MTADGSLVLGCQRIPVPVVLAYDPTSPWEVVLTFVGVGVDGTDVQWSFARDLLEDGLSAPAGDGAVRVVPDADEHTLAVHVTSSDGTGVVLLGWDDVAAFADASFELVAAGQEQVSWDAALLELLSAPADG